MSCDDVIAPEAVGRHVHEDMPADCDATTVAEEVADAAVGHQ